MNYVIMMKQIHRDEPTYKIKRNIKKQIVENHALERPNRNKKSKLTSHHTSRILTKPNKSKTEIQYNIKSRGIYTQERKLTYEIHTNNRRQLSMDIDNIYKMEIKNQREDNT